MQIMGYADRLSVSPGDELVVMVSTSVPSYRAQLVRLYSVDDRDGGPGYREHTVPSDLDGPYPGAELPLPVGSYVRVATQDRLDMGGAIGISLWTWTALPIRGRSQGILTATGEDRNAGISIALGSDGHIEFRVWDTDGAVLLRSDEPLPQRSWCFVAASYSPTGAARLTWKRTSGWPQADSFRTMESHESGRIDLTRGASEILIGAGSTQTISGIHVPRDVYNGKIDAPAIYGHWLDDDSTAALLEGLRPVDAGAMAAWDFASGIDSNAAQDTGPHNLAGEVVNAPTRGVTGHNWTGREIDYRLAPDEYGAIHFHEDDLEDACWPVSLRVRMPDELPSGVYAVKLVGDDAEDYVPFYVTPKLWEPAGEILFLAPTNTYLAYANERLHDQHDYSKLVSEQITIEPVDEHLVAHPELGLSLYDTHRDGSGVCYSSRRRPILNMRPKYRTWLNDSSRHFAADFYIIDWLERTERRYDVATDEDLHRHGTALLGRYKVLITGSHPEYWTAPMMDALQRYLADGGRLMYLGGNGFYWVTSIDPARPHLVEVRRGHAGTRCWESAPGEVVHSTTGEPGGLWRHRGRPAQALVGVGFTSQGWGGATGYERTRQSFEERFSFAFEGIDPDEVIGDLGLVMGGAAGDELDRADPALGTPPHAAVLASSGPHSDYYQLAVEDTLMTLPGTGGSECPDVRSDLVYFTTSGTGAVFSVGSINWAGALAYGDYDNNVARLTRNVLDRFLGP